jgi:hypothetical protein
MYLDRVESAQYRDNRPGQPSNWVEIPELRGIQWDYARRAFISRAFVAIDDGNISLVPQLPELRDWNFRGTIWSNDFNIAIKLADITPYGGFTMIQEFIFGGNPDLVFAEMPSLRWSFKNWEKRTYQITLPYVFFCTSPGSGGWFENEPAMGRRTDTDSESGSSISFIFPTGASTLSDVPPAFKFSEQFTVEELV